MPSLIAISIKKEELENLSKDAIYEGKTTYYNLMVNVNDENDQFGNNASVTAQQSKEDREAKVKRHFLGSGKVIWTKGEITTAKEAGGDEPF